MKIVTVVGARPQFVKAAALSRAFAAHPALREVIIHTGQHYDENMSEVFFREMDIPAPDHRLHVGSGSHGAMTGRMLEKIEAVLLQQAPDCVLVYGDTNSTLAGALAAAKLHIPVVHVEAGLRSFDMRMPEEINRRLTDQISQALFCPTATAVENLRAEGVAHPVRCFDMVRGRPYFAASSGSGASATAAGRTPPELSHPAGPAAGSEAAHAGAFNGKLTANSPAAPPLPDYGEASVALLAGDVMQDAALHYATMSADRATAFPRLSQQLGADFALATVHRAENTDDPARLAGLLHGLGQVGARLPVVLPLHPRTKARLEQHGLSLPQGVTACDPVGYFDMLEMLRHCSLVLTDSGGLQKEAYFFSRPCVTLREATEWVELVDSGTNILAGCDPQAIENAAEQLLKRCPDFDQSLYGGGVAAVRMAAYLAG